MKLMGFFRCECGKIHSYGGLSRTSYCTCGIRLYFFAISRGEMK